MSEINIKIPTLHKRQIEIYKDRSKLDVICCGRRFGKTKDMVTRACMGGIRGKSEGLFTPFYKQLSEPFDMIVDILKPIIKTASRNEGKIKLKTGGVIDFWTLTDNMLAGRGREYDNLYIDEAAFTKNGQMLDIWYKSLKPTLLTTKGTATVYSTPNGIDEDNFFYRCWHDETMGFKRHHAPTNSNPYVDQEEFEKERLLNHPLVFKQEYLAEFIDFSGIAFFSSTSLLVDNLPVDYPMHNDCVFATIDSAMKDGSTNDGTAVIYWAKSSHFGHPLVILDWDIVQINSDLLVNWLPTVFDNLEHYALLTKSRGGSVGAWIEDKGSGITLNQTAARMGWDARPITGEITSTGKDGRAISASGAVYRGEVKLSANAYNKVVDFKGSQKNHLLTQVTSYKIGDKDAAKRADDLSDCFCYGVIIGLGGSEGF